MVDGIPSAWKDGLAGLSAAYNALSGVPNAVSSGVAGGLEGLHNSLNNFQSAGTTTVTLPPQGSDTFSLIGDGLRNVGYGFQGLGQTGGELIDNAKSTIGNFIADSKFAETMKGISGAAGRCYEYVWKGLEKNKENNRDSPWAKIMADLDRATSGLQTHAYQFAEAMDTKLIPEGKVKKLNINNPQDVPAGAICVVDPKYFPGGQAATSGDINVALGNGNFRNYGDMNSLMNNSAVWPHVKVYVPV